MHVDIRESLLEGIFLTKDLTKGKEWLTTVLRFSSLGREIWNHFTCPGTFHALMLAVLGLLNGNGWQYVPPQRAHKLRKLRHKKSGDGHQKLGAPGAINW